MATGEAQTELHPSSAAAKALLAALWGARSDGPNHREMGTPDRQPADREAHPGAPSVKPGPGGSGNRSQAAVRCWRSSASARTCWVDTPSSILCSTHALL